MFDPPRNELTVLISLGRSRGAPMICMPTLGQLLCPVRAAVGLGSSPERSEQRSSSAKISSLLTRRAVVRGKARCTAKLSPRQLPTAQALGSSAVRRDSWACESALAQASEDGKTDSSSSLTWMSSVILKSASALCHMPLRTALSRSRLSAGSPRTLPCQGRKTDRHSTTSRLTRTTPQRPLPPTM